MLNLLLRVPRESDKFNREHRTNPSIRMCFIHFSENSRMAKTLNGRRFYLLAAIEMFGVFLTSEKCVEIIRIYII